MPVSLTFTDEAVTAEAAALKGEIANAMTAGEVARAIFGFLWTVLRAAVLFMVGVVLVIVRWLAEKVVLFLELFADPLATN